MTERQNDKKELPPGLPLTDEDLAWSIHRLIEMGMSEEKVCETLSMEPSEVKLYIKVWENLQKSKRKLERYK